MYNMIKPRTIFICKNAYLCTNNDVITCFPECNNRCNDKANYNKGDCCTIITLKIFHDDDDLFVLYRFVNEENRRENKLFTFGSRVTMIDIEESCNNNNKNDMSGIVSKGVFKKRYKNSGYNTNYDGVGYIPNKHCKYYRTFELLANQKLNRVDKSKYVIIEISVFAKCGNNWGEIVDVAQSTPFRIYDSKEKVFDENFAGSFYDKSYLSRPFVIHVNDFTKRSNAKVRHRRNTSFDYCNNIDETSLVDDIMELFQ